jgi:hypothetical protein
MDANVMLVSTAVPPAKRPRPTVVLLLGGILALGALFAAQKPWRQYPGLEYEGYPVPPDFQVKGEWAFARLMYPPVSSYFGGFQFEGDWRRGGSNWTMDYPRSDRHIASAVRRLTRIQARSVEEPVNLEDGNQYDWPWLYAVEVGHWNLDDAQAKALREYLLRGGFFMCDDFHGTDEWNTFIASMRKVFPDRPVIEIPDKDAIFHTVYDLDDRYQVPGAQYLETGQTYEKGTGGKQPHWRAIYDDHGRIMVAMCFNMDLGDSWEHADNPQYPERFSALGIRTGINYLIYAFSH